MGRIWAASQNLRELKNAGRIPLGLHSSCIFCSNKAQTSRKDTLDENFFSKGFERTLRGECRDSTVLSRIPTWDR
jgi:hypothetical protein